MLRSIVLSLCVALAALPALASTHVWLGTANNRISDPANWGGGSPLNDPDAEIVFDGWAAHYDVFNDVPNLRFKTLRFAFQGFSLFGEPLLVSGESTIDSTYDVRIFCDIRDEGSLTLSSTAGPIDLRGAIGGPGKVFVVNAAAIFSGPNANTYTGETVLKQEGSLTLKKDKPGVIALPGNLRSEFGFQERLIVSTPNQIADDAQIALAESGELQLYADETLHALQLAERISVPQSEQPVPTLTVDALEVARSVSIDSNLHLTQSVLDIPQNASIGVSGKVDVPPSGITLRGAGSVSWGGDYTAPAKIEGITANLRTPKSAVEMTGGEIAGNVASLHATGGAIVNRLVSSSDVHLGPDVTLSARASTYSPGSFIDLNGVLDLADATLDLLPASFATGPVVLIRNASAQPVIGTFKGIAEGGIAFNRFRVSYHGGDGNDVTVTDLRKPDATFTITQDPKPAYFGEPVTITATAAGGSGTPAGTITFRNGGTNIGSAPLVNGKATLAWTTPTADNYSVYFRYLGDATYGSGDITGTALDIRYRKPAIASVEPATVQGGAKSHLVVRGSGFVPGTIVSVNGGGLTSMVISSTEIHATVDFRDQRAAATLPVTAVTPAPMVISDPVTLTVTGVPQPPSAITFDAHSASATITPKGKSAWLSSDFTYAAKFLTDDDGDGVVRWPMITPEAAFAVVDIGTGNYSLSAYGNATVDPLPFPSNTFVKDAAGNVSSIALQTRDGLRWSLLWVRPGAGAWQMLLRSGEDDDHLYNNVLITSVNGMLKLGDSPEHPAGFLRGDVLIVMAQSSGPYAVPVYAARLGTELDDTGAGVIQPLYGIWDVKENAKAAHLTLIRTGGSTGTASVHYQTIDRDGSSGTRFVPSSGVVTFASGQLLATIDIPLIDDMVWSSYALFDVRLSDPVSATLGEGTEFVVVVHEDDPPPVVDVVGPDRRTVVMAGKAIQLALTLSGATSLPIPVVWQTSGATTEQGVVVFAPGETTKIVPLSFPQGNIALPARILVDIPSVQSRFVTIIVEGEVQTRVLANGVTVDENAGVAHIDVSLAPRPLNGYSVNWATNGGSAKSGIDYVAKSGTLTFGPAGGTQVIDIPINDDTTADGDKSFTVELSDSSYNLRATPAVTIIDNETTSRPVLSIVDHASAGERSGLTTIGAEIRLSQPSTIPVRVRCTTANGSALADLDYAAIDTTLTFAPGETTKTLPVTIFPDALKEGDESFTVTLSAAENATIANASCAVTIVNDTPNHRRASR